MKSNKDLTPREFEISKELKFAMNCSTREGMKVYVNEAIRLLYSE